MQRLADKDKIVYAPIDDAENNLEERTRPGVSAGVREVVGVFLRFTEGAYAIQRGNSVIQVFTNLPEQVDKAVLSRIQARFAIDGATTPEDFYDQDGIWYRKFKNVDEGFVSMAPLSGYEFLSCQSKISSLSEVEIEEPELTDDRMCEVLRKVGKEYSRKVHGFFAYLFRGVKSFYPSFSSRDVRNIQKAVDSRVLDFDLPEKWFEDLEVFFRQSYAHKFELVKVLMKENMKGLSFADIRYRETIKYLSIFAGITNVERERAIAERLRVLDIEVESQRRFKDAK